MSVRFLAFAVLLVAPALPASADQPLPTFTYAPAPALSTTAGTERRLLLGANGERTTSAVVIVPAARGAAMPGVLWVHWLGEPATTNHTEFLSDAQALAARGIASVLVDMPWSQTDWFTTVRTPANDFDDTVANVIALRRALDALVAVPGVDATRLAFVGHDFGAMDGALLLAVDPRPKYAILMTPTLSFWEWNLLGAQPDDRAAYVTQMSAFDLPGWLAQGRQHATLLQFAKNDAYVARATASAIRNAVPDRERTLKTYDTDHALDIPAAHADRRAWLLARFGLTPG